VLPEPHHVQNVLRSMLKPPTLMTLGPSKSRVFIDCSTIDPRSSRHAANAVASSGQGRFVDAPMSGGVVGASASTLTFMIGAPSELVDPVTQILLMMGKRVLHMGEQGAGLKAKLANNYLLGLNNIATCEAMNFGTKWGLDPKKLAELINTSTGKCWPSEVNNPVPFVVQDSPASKGYEGGFGVSLMRKDLKLALQAAHESGAPSVLGHEALSVYDLVETDENCKGKDFSVVYRYLGGKE
jgi:3-hydroxyisobutyrate/3-hydroxypropionate dehydrogenase